MDTKTINADTAVSEVTKEQLISDFKVVIADAEALLKATASHGGESLAALREKATESLGVAKVKLADAQAKALEKGRQAAKATDDYVHESPWTAVGIAVGVGILVGVLLGRR